MHTLESSHAQIHIYGVSWRTILGEPLPQATINYHELVRLMDAILYNINVYLVLNLF